MSVGRMTDTVRRVRASVALLCLVGCSGPAAPDAAVCRDVVTRLCTEPLCEPVATSFGVDGGPCEATLLQRSGCHDDGFMFSTPSRAEFLDCRIPLLRQGPSQKIHPACADVAEVFLVCPQVVRFFGGTP